MHHIIHQSKRQSPNYKVGIPVGFETHINGTTDDKSLVPSSGYLDFYHLNLVALPKTSSTALILFFKS